MKPCSWLCTEQSGAGLISVIALIYILFGDYFMTDFVVLIVDFKERNIITLVQVLMLH